jgi:acyl dehydratase
MSLLDLEGSTYGPFPVRVSGEQVAAYVAATGDDVSRWAEHAPPSFAGALLFVAAPSFLHAEDVKPYTKLLVHADQAFTWHRALAVDETVAVDGELARVRERGGVSFVTFRSTVRSGDGVVIEATSTFLMGDGPPGSEPRDEPEPPVEARAGYDPLPRDISPEVGAVPEMRRSASRLDLVRYAAASGDFNPVHFDHETALRAGFPGVLVHGLLMGAWLLQLAAAHSERPHALASARLRFRNPLRPARPARVTAAVESMDNGEAGMSLALRDDTTEYVDARVRVRMA